MPSTPLDPGSRLSRKLRLLQLGVIVSFVCAGSMMALSRIDVGAVALVVTLVGWFTGPFFLLALLQQVRTALRLEKDRGLVTLSFFSLLLAFALVPMMLLRTADDVGEATGDPRLRSRVKPLAIGYGVGSFFGGFLAVLIPVVGIVLAPLVQLVLLGLATQVLIQQTVEVSGVPVPVASGSTGHAAPVGIRTH